VTGALRGDVLLPSAAWPTLFSSFPSERDCGRP